MEPLDLLLDESGGDSLPLPPELAAFYGPLRMAGRSDRPHVFANFVASVDGIVAVGPPAKNGAAISGGNAHDRAVMGLLRAVSDAVIIGAGNLRAEGDHVWTAERICPELAGPYARARAALGKASGPLQVVVSASGQVDPSRRVFAGEAPSMVVTTGAGADRLRATRATIRTVVARSSMGWITLSAVLEAAKLGPGTLVLIESGPTSTTRFLAEGGVDELFLTRAPIFVGRASAPATLALVEGRVFRPGELSGRLVSLRRSGDYLFLRYRMNGIEPARRAVESTS